MMTFRKTVMRDSPNRIVQLQLLVPDLVNQHLALSLSKHQPTDEYMAGQDRLA